MNLFRRIRPSILVRLAPVGLAAAVAGALVVGASPAVTAGPGAAAGAAPAAGVCARKGDIDAKALNAKIVAMRQASRSDADIQRVLADDWCLTTVSTGPARTLASTGSSSVVWKTLTISYDNQTKWYYANGTWSWNTAGYKSEANPGCQLKGKGDGGRDAVGLRLTGGTYQLKSGGYDATAWGNPSDNKYVNDYGAWGMTQSIANEHGIGFTGQDSVRKMENSKKLCPGAYDLSTYGGSIVLAFKRLNGSCANTQVFGDYVHTWSTTGVNSIGAYTNGFSIGWAKEGHDWTKQSAGGTARTC